MSSTLYTFRRCPYAMRARLALKISGQNPQVREIVLRNKPQAMLAASPKGTVPVLVTQSEAVVDESFDIMLWALKRHDPDGWLDVLDGANAQEARELIKVNDTEFKAALDRYKYPNRFEEEEDGDCDAISLRNRDLVQGHFSALNARLAKHKGAALFGPFSIADAAILPFIRQAAHVDRDWFDELDMPYLHQWLSAFLSGSLFASVMVKLEPWQEGDAPLYFQEVFTKEHL